ncbi:MAG: hypothetical protein RL417_1164 [Pseudomonadota bacterium]|jgi:hypothetical protein
MCKKHRKIKASEMSQLGGLESSWGASGAQRERPLGQKGAIRYTQKVRRKRPSRSLSLFAVATAEHCGRRTIPLRSAWRGGVFGSGFI